MGMDAAVRRNVDARLVSYAMSVLDTFEITPEIRTTFQGCAAAALQATSGLVALPLACRAAANSPVLQQRLDGGQIRHLQTLLEGLASTVEEAWQTDLKELFEVIIVLACETAGTVEEEVLFRQWANGLKLDSRPMAMIEDKTVADIEIDQTPAAKRSRVRKPRSSKDIYHQERLENLVARAIALGVTAMRPVMMRGTIVVVGTDAKRNEQKLVKLRGSVHDAEELCDQAMSEIKRLDAVDTAM